MRHHMTHLYAVLVTTAALFPTRASASAGTARIEWCSAGGDASCRAHGDAGATCDTTTDTCSCTAQHSTGNLCGDSSNAVSEVQVTLAFSASPGVVDAALPMLRAATEAVLGGDVSRIQSTDSTARATLPAAKTRRIAAADFTAYLDSLYTLPRHTSLRTTLGTPLSATIRILPPCDPPGAATSERLAGGECVATSCNAGFALSGGECAQQQSGASPAGATQFQWCADDASCRMHGDSGASCSQDTLTCSCGDGFGPVQSARVCTPGGGDASASVLVEMVWKVECDGFSHSFLSLVGEVIEASLGSRVDDIDVDCGTVRAVVNNQTYSSLHASAAGIEASLSERYLRSHVFLFMRLLLGMPTKTSVTILPLCDIPNAITSKATASGGCMPHQCSAGTVAAGGACVPRGLCEAAWAKGERSLCFLSMEGLDSGMWGWTNELGGSQAMQLWAGAEGCNTAAGRLVGDVDVTYAFPNVDIAVRMREGWGVVDAALYAGLTRLPLTQGGAYTASPGYFPFKKTRSASYRLRVPTRDLHMALHVNVCPGDATTTTTSPTPAPTLPPSVPETPAPNNAMWFQWCLGDASCRMHGDSGASCSGYECSCSDGFSNAVPSAAVCASGVGDSADAMVQLVWGNPFGSQESVFLALLRNVVGDLLDSNVLHVELVDGVVRTLLGGVGYARIASLDVSSRLRTLYATSPEYGSMRDTIGLPVSSVVTVYGPCTSPGATQAERIANGSCAAVACQDGFTLRDGACVPSSGGPSVAFRWCRGDAACRMHGDASASCDTAASSCSCGTGFSEVFGAKVCVPDAGVTVGRDATAASSTTRDLPADVLVEAVWRVDCAIVTPGLAEAVGNAITAAAGVASAAVERDCGTIRAALPAVRYSAIVGLPDALATRLAAATAVQAVLGNASSITVTVLPPCSAPHAAVMSRNADGSCSATSCQQGYALAAGSCVPAAGGCRSAWAKGASSMCFLNMRGLQTTAWGWSNQLAQSERMGLWAGALNCNTGWATSVGSVQATLQGHLQLAVEAAPGWRVENASLWLGEERLPRNSAGQLSALPGYFAFQRTGEARFVFSVSTNDMLHAALHVWVCPGSGSSSTDAPTPAPSPDTTPAPPSRNATTEVVWCSSDASCRIHGDSGATCSGASTGCACTDPTTTGVVPNAPVCAAAPSDTSSLLVQLHWPDLRLFDRGFLSLLQSLLEALLGGSVSVIERDDGVVRGVVEGVRYSSTAGADMGAYLSAVYASSVEYAGMKAVLGLPYRTVLSVIPPCSIPGANDTLRSSNGSCTAVACNAGYLSLGGDCVVSDATPAPAANTTPAFFSWCADDAHCRTHGDVSAVCSSAASTSACTCSDTGHASVNGSQVCTPGGADAEGDVLVEIAWQVDCDRFTEGFAKLTGRTLEAATRLTLLDIASDCSTVRAVLSNSPYSRMAGIPHAFDTQLLQDYTGSDLLYAVMEAVLGWPSSITVTLLEPCSVAGATSTQRLPDGSCRALSCSGGRILADGACLPPRQCVTAWAKGSQAYCFQNLRHLYSTRWGWTNRLAGSETMGLWAGAENCNTNTGEQVADVFVTTYSNRLDIEVIFRQGWRMDDAAMWVGTEPLPWRRRRGYTASPSRFPFKRSGSAAFKFRVSTFSLFVALHVTACPGAPEPETTPSPATLAPAATSTSIAWCGSDATCRMHGDTAGSCHAASNTCTCGAGYPGVADAKLCVGSGDDTVPLLVTLTWAADFGAFQSTFISLVKSLLEAALGGSVEAIELTDGSIRAAMNATHDAVAAADIPKYIETLYELGLGYATMRDTLGTPSHVSFAVLAPCDVPGASEVERAANGTCIASTCSPGFYPDGGIGCVSATSPPSFTSTAEMRWCSGRASCRMHGDSGAECTPGVVAACSCTAGYSPVGEAKVCVPDSASPPRDEQAPVLVELVWKADCDVFAQSFLPLVKASLSSALGADVTAIAADCATVRAVADGVRYSALQAAAEALEASLQQSFSNDPAYNQMQDLVGMPTLFTSTVLTPCEIYGASGVARLADGSCAATGCHAGYTLSGGECVAGDRCVSAWAKGRNSLCFLNVRDCWNPVWGWTNKIWPGAESLGLWVGATGCNTGRAWQAGSVAVSLDGSRLDLAIHIAEGWRLSHASLWLGATKLPLSRYGAYLASPWHFPYKSSGGSGRGWFQYRCQVRSLYLALHVTVCPLPKPDPTEAPPTLSPRTFVPVTAAPPTLAPPTPAPATPAPDTPAPPTPAPLDVNTEFIWCLNDASCAQNGDVAAVCVNSSCTCSDGFTPVSLAEVCAGVGETSTATASVLVQLEFNASFGSNQTEFVALLTQGLETLLGGTAAVSLESNGTFTAVLDNVTYAAVSQFDIDTFIATFPDLYAFFAVASIPRRSSLTVLPPCDVPNAATTARTIDGNCTATSCATGYTLDSNTGTCTRDPICETAWAVGPDNRCFDIPGAGFWSSFFTSGTELLELHVGPAADPSDCTAGGSRIVGTVVLEDPFGGSGIHQVRTPVLQPGHTLQGTGNLWHGATPLPADGSGDPSVAPSDFIYDAAGLIFTPFPSFVAVQYTVCHVPPEDTPAPPTAAPPPPCTIAAQTAQVALVGSSSTTDIPSLPAANGMPGWDLPSGDTVSLTFPQGMLGSAAALEAFFPPGAAVAAGSLFRVDCPASCSATPCEVLVAVYSCHACAAGSDGRFPVLLPLAGWGSGGSGCAPSFSADNATHSMRAFRMLVPAGGSVATPPLELPLLHSAVFVRQGASNCSALTSDTTCNAAQGCAWGSGGGGGAAECVPSGCGFGTSSTGCQTCAPGTGVPTSDPSPGNATSAFEWCSSDAMCRRHGDADAACNTTAKACDCSPGFRTLSAAKVCVSEQDANVTAPLRIVVTWQVDCSKWDAAFVSLMREVIQLALNLLFPVGLIEVTCGSIRATAIVDNVPYSTAAQADLEHQLAAKYASDSRFAAMRDALGMPASSSIQVLQPCDIPHASGTVHSLQDGSCSATACDSGYDLRDGSCVPQGGGGGGLSQLALALVIAGSVGLCCAVVLAVATCVYCSKKSSNHKYQHEVVASPNEPIS